MKSTIFSGSRMRKLGVALVAGAVAFGGLGWYGETQEMAGSHNVSQAEAAALQTRGADKDNSRHEMAPGKESDRQLRGRGHGYDGHGGPYCDGNGPRRDGNGPYCDGNGPHHDGNGPHCYDRWDNDDE